MAIVQKPVYTGVTSSKAQVAPVKDLTRRPLDLSGMLPQEALDALSRRAASPVAMAARAGSTEEAMVERDEDKQRPAMPGSRRTRKRAQFGVGYNTGVSI